MAGTLKFATTAELRAMQVQVDAQLNALAAQQGIGGGNPANNVIRDLLPSTDLLASGSIEYFEQQVTAGAYAQPNYSGTNPDDRAFIIYGVAIHAEGSGEPRTTAIKFWNETGRTSIKDVWNIQTAWPGRLASIPSALPDAPVIVLADAPIMYLPNRGFNIDQYGIQTGVDHIEYLGRVIEPKGKVITGELPPGRTT